MALTNSDFWMEKPRALGWRGLSLLIPSLITAVGLCSFAVLAFSFTELQTLPPQFKKALVLSGAFSLALGGEVGTVFSVIEIYRKAHRSAQDKWALFISGSATIGAFLLAFAALLGVNAGWSDTVREWGPIAQGILTAMDGYGLFVELGLYLGTYDERRKFYEFKREEFRQALMTQKLNGMDKNGVDKTVHKSVQISTNLSSKKSAQNQSSRKRLSLDRRRAKLLTLYTEQPALSMRGAAAQLGCSASTVRSDIEALEREGRAYRNNVGEIIVVEKGVTDETQPTAPV
jgi:hypothetical protein